MKSMVDLIKQQPASLVHCPKACCDWIMTKGRYAGPHSDQFQGGGEKVKKRQTKKEAKKEKGVSS